MFVSVERRRGAVWALAAGTHFSTLSYKVLGKSYKPCKKMLSYVYRYQNSSQKQETYYSRITKPATANLIWNILVNTLVLLLSEPTICSKYPIRSVSCIEYRVLRSGD